MRTGGVQQSLGAEAAAVVRQAVSLARQRGHTQVTPLHVASAMLSEAGGLLRAACVRCQSDPLQCNALELCLSVALDRRPRRAMTTSHDCGGHVPAPSNAFAAALKRAQAHQRRGSMDGSLGQRLAVKVELEQLVVSILDDPSVDRVMREVGFSSSQVKANVAVSMDRTGSDMTSPYQVYNKITRVGQPSLDNVPEVHQVVVRCNSGSQAKSGTWLPCDGTQVVTTLTSPILIPPWLRRYQDTNTTGSTHCGTSLQIQDACRQRRFMELTAENLKILCSALELHIPRHKDIVPGISTTVLRCRAGMMKRASKPTILTTWLLFHGRDEVGKMAIAQELAKLIFGSHTEFILVNSDSPTPSNQVTLKRHRSWDNDNGLLGARLFQAVLKNPRRVIIINGIDQLDNDSKIRMRNAIVKGTMSGYNGDAVSLEDAIVVLSSELVEYSKCFVSSPSVKRPTSNNRNCERGYTVEKEVKSCRFSLDLNAFAEDGEEEKDELNDDMGFQDVVDGVFLFD